MDVNKFLMNFNRRYFINYLRTDNLSQRVIKLYDILKDVKTHVAFFVSKD